MTVVAGVVASGAFASVLPLGFAIAQSLGPRRAPGALATALPLGVGAVSIPLTLCAVLGEFHAQWIGALGWCATLVLAARMLSRPVRERARRRVVPGAGERYAIGALLVLAAALYFGFPAESPLGSRDEGLYSLTGMALDRAGTLTVPVPDDLARAPALFASVSQGIDFHLPGIPAGKVLKSQFAPLLPAWIAQLHGVGGDRLLYRVNALFALAAIVVFHALARRVLRPAFAVLATVVFALQPAQIWSARINLSEPLGQLLALGGILLAVDSLRARNDARMPAGDTLWSRNARTFAAAALFALACFARLDMLIVTPLFFAAAIAVVLFGRADAGAARRLARLGVATLAFQTVAVLALMAYSPAYVADHARAPLTALVVTAILALAWMVAQRAARHGAPMPRGRRHIGGVAVAVLCAGFAYAAFVRPHIGSYAIIPGHSAIAGMRDFREESLRNLAAYLGWPALFLALAGACVAALRVARGKCDASLTMLVTLMVGTSVVFLAAPRVSPDHFWAIRRFVTLAMPMIVLFAGFGAQRAVTMGAGWRSRPGVMLAAVAAAAALLWMQRATLFVSENAGLTAQLRSLEARLPPGPLVIRDHDALATTLALGFGRTVLPLRDAQVAVDAAAQSFWRHCATAHCTLIHRSFAGLAGLQLGPTDHASLTRRYIAPAYTPLPKHIANETTEILLTPVRGLAPGLAPRNAGAARDWRLADRGFYRDEPSGPFTARWTDGHAELALPPWPADELEIRLAVARDTDVRIAIDGTPFFDGALAVGEHTLRHALPRNAGAPRILSIESSTFVPEARGLGTDPRSLGVSVRAIRLIDDSVGWMTPMSPDEAYRSAVRPAGGNVALAHRVGRTGDAPMLAIDVENRGDAVWPAAVDAVGANHYVALGILWQRAGAHAPVLEQRVQLPYSLRPGERVRMNVRLDGAATGPATLPEGAYDVRVGLVHEGVAWFADRGQRTLEFHVQRLP